MSAAPVLPAADAAAQFTAEILQGHREAFAALRQILAAAVNAATSPDGASPPAGLPGPLARTLTLAFRTANALLRTKPPEIEEDDQEQDAKPFRAPPRPLTRDDVLNIAASQRAGNRFLPIQLVPRLKAWQEYADHMGFPAPFSFPPELLEKFPGRAELPPQHQSVCPRSDLPSDNGDHANNQPDPPALAT